MSFPTLRKSGTISLRARLHFGLTRAVDHTVSSSIEHEIEASQDGNNAHSLRECVGLPVKVLDSADTLRSAQRNRSAPPSRSDNATIQGSVLHTGDRLGSIPHNGGQNGMALTTLSIASTDQRATPLPDAAQQSRNTILARRNNTQIPATLVRAATMSPNTAMRSVNASRGVAPIQSQTAAASAVAATNRNVARNIISAHRPTINHKQNVHRSPADLPIIFIGQLSTVIPPEICHPMTNPELRRSLPIIALLVTNLKELDKSIA